MNTQEFDQWKQDAVLIDWHIENDVSDNLFQKNGKFFCVSVSLMQNKVTRIGDPIPVEPVRSPSVKISYVDECGNCLFTQHKVGSYDIQPMVELNKQLLDIKNRISGVSQSLYYGDRRDLAAQLDQVIEKLLKLM